MVFYSVAGIKLLIMSERECHLEMSSFSGGSKNVPRGLPEAYYSGFSGCIKYVKINNRTLDLLMDRDSHDRVEFCNSLT